MIQKSIYDTSLVYPAILNLTVFLEHFSIIFDYFLKLFVHRSSKDLLLSSSKSIETVYPFKQLAHDSSSSSSWIILQPKIGKHGSLVFRRDVHNVECIAWEPLRTVEEDAARRGGGQLDGWSGTRVGSLTRSEAKGIIRSRDRA